MSASKASRSRFTVAGLSLTYHQAAMTVTVEARPLSVMYIKGCPRGERIQKPMRPLWRIRAWKPVMSAAPDRWIRWTTGCVALLALIAGTFSDLHMHLLVELHGQPGWVAALAPLSVDGMIVAASTTLLARVTGNATIAGFGISRPSATTPARVAMTARPTAGRMIGGRPSSALSGGRGFWAAEWRIRQRRAALGSAINASAKTRLVRWSEVPRVLHFAPLDPAYKPCALSYGRQPNHKQP